MYAVLLKTFGLVSVPTSIKKMFGSHPSRSWSRLKKLRSWSRSDPIPVKKNFGPGTKAFLPGLESGTTLLISWNYFDVGLKLKSYFVKLCHLLKTFSLKTWSKEYYWPWKCANNRLVSKSTNQIWAYFHTLESLVSNGENRRSLSPLSFSSYWENSRTLGLFGWQTYCIAPTIRLVSTRR